MHGLPFGGIISPFKNTLDACTQGWDTGDDLWQLQQFLSVGQHSFCPQGFLLLSSIRFQLCLWRVTPRRELLSGLWQDCCCRFGTYCDLCHPFEPQPWSCTFYQEYLWIYNCSEDIWPINNSKLSIFPAVFLYTYHLLLFSWPGNNILYGAWV